MLMDKKKIPGPDKYDNTGLKQKVHGFYGPSEVKCSVISSVAFEKKIVPGPNAYKDNRGKDMSVLLKEKAKAFLYQYKPAKYDSGVKWKKTRDPAPGTYHDAEAKDHCSEMRRSISNTIPNAISNTISALAFLDA